MAESDSDKIYNLAMKQVETNTNLNNAQHDINVLGNQQRQDVIELRATDERIESKVDSHAFDLKIYKIIIGLISSYIVGIVLIAAWVVQNIDNLRSFSK